ncbi:U6 snRNA associated Sm-like protein Lsm4 [Plasmodium ovale wallikeri]|uniref:U6 snRNA-associated Sm-like protein LSm4 n=1 Tax=Plasmodium ovale wallikeri TaxID=864142 RepID=A0A1A8YTC8_PLAOA|nr:U6 snRNA associated Sm-like protein Lsm4 [Plasmodium ovale wallikeri]SBT35325.1 U6 snRNA associated Sm-like protein Lsm4 [Plasmodium ovale wallikeri]
MIILFFFSTQKLSIILKLKIGEVNYGGKEIYFIFPLTLLKCSQNQPVMVELKNGETYSGFLVFCDRFMNLHMKNIICTSKDGDKFWKISECYVRGNSVKYIRVQDQAIEQAIEETTERNEKTRKKRKKKYKKPEIWEEGVVAEVEAAAVEEEQMEEEDGGGI